MRLCKDIFTFLGLDKRDDLLITLYIVIGNSKIIQNLLSKRKKSKVNYYRNQHAKIDIERTIKTIR